MARGFIAQQYSKTWVFLLLVIGKRGKEKDLRLVGSLLKLACMSN
jgi:hypothetical protein